MLLCVCGLTIARFNTPILVPVVENIRNSSFNLCNPYHIFYYENLSDAGTRDKREQHEQNTHTVSASLFYLSHKEYTFMRNEGNFTIFRHT